MKNHIQPANTRRLTNNTILSQLMSVVSGNQGRLVALSMLAFLLLASVTSFADSATWNLNPSNDAWEDASNWTPATVPNGPNDTATFDVSNTTGLFVNPGSGVIEVNGIVFNPGASAFTISVESFFSYPEMLTISGAGVINNSGIIQSFFANSGEWPGVIEFTNSATAGNLTVFSTEPGRFPDFARSPEINFLDTSTAGSATLIANTDDFGTPGIITFNGDSAADAARVEVFGDGKLDISAHNAPGVTVGSLEGDGVVALGANNLAIGSNNLSTTFSGVIRGAGSLTKIGTGKLTLASSNKYAGGTVVNEGVLLINNKRASGTGTRAVQVNAGTLGGTGIIGGAVTVGTGSGSGAFLSPGIDAASHHALAIRNTLNFDSDGTYRCGFNSGTAHADKVVANSVTISSGAQFSFEDSNASVLPVGTVLTVIDNTAATPIRGTYSNLADGSNITVGSNTFQVDYEGGDGNDLTLTVVP